MEIKILSTEMYQRKESGYFCLLFVIKVFKLWKLIKQSVGNSTAVFDEVTILTSSTYSLLIDVISHAATMMRYLQKEKLFKKTHNFRSAVKDNMNMVTSFNLENLYENWAYFLSTFLNPHCQTILYIDFEIEQARTFILKGAPKICLDSLDCLDHDEIDNSTEI